MQSATSKNVYLISIYCNRGSLWDYTEALKKKKGWLSLSNVLTILRDILTGYIELWNKGIVHLDFRTQNVFIHDNVSLIADFGNSKESSEKEDYKYDMIGLKKIIEHLIKPLESQVLIPLEI